MPMELRVRRDRIDECELVEGEPAGDPDAGEAVLAVERFALTANNVTYAVVGDRLGYWDLFGGPAGWGVVPAWGYATVTASRAEGVAEGDRVFGIVPMAQELRVRPLAGGTGFADASPHRSSLSPFYNRYFPAVDAEDIDLIMRPLFGTAVLLDLALTESEEPGPVVLTSASSRTAYGLAHLLKKRGVTVYGLTSPQRAEWVAGLGLYDAVHAYDDVDLLDRATAVVDFAGDRELLRRLHAHLDPGLRRSIRVGFTHREAAPAASPLPGPEPEFFFAPDEMVRRGRGLGPVYATAWADFAPVVARTLRIERVSGGERLIAVWNDLVAGRAEPATGYIASL